MRCPTAVAGSDVATLALRTELLARRRFGGGGAREHARAVVADDARVDVQVRAKHRQACHLLLGDALASLQGVAAGIGVGDRDAADRLPRARAGVLVIVAVVKRILHIAVAMRPTVDSDCGDVAGAREIRRDRACGRARRESAPRIPRTASAGASPARRLNCWRAVRPWLGAPATCTRCRHIGSAGIARMAVAAEADRKIERDRAWNDIGALIALTLSAAHGRQFRTSTLV